MNRSLKGLFIACGLLAATQSVSAAEKPALIAATAPVAAKQTPVKNNTIAPAIEDSASMKPLIEGSNRMRNRAGIYFSVIGEPFGVGGINVGWNATDFMRLHLGGSVLIDPSATTALLGTGAGVKFMVPTWNLTPVIGSQITIYPAGFWIQSENFGLEYTAPSGFYVGAGINTMYVGGVIGSQTESGASSASFGRILPYLNIGTFF